MKRFFKAIVFFRKKGSTFFQIIEDQHFIFRNVGLLFLYRNTLRDLIFKAMKQLPSEREEFHLIAKRKQTILIR